MPNTSSDFVRPFVKAVTALFVTEVALCGAMSVHWDDGTPTGKTWTQQWVIKPKDPKKKIIIGVIYDTFNVGRGDEYEFVQMTTDANSVIAPVTDRMPLLLDDDDLDLWLGTLRATLEDVMALIKTYKFNPHEWDIWVEDPNKKPPRPQEAEGQVETAGLVLTSANSSSAGTLVR